MRGAVQRVKEPAHLAATLARMGVPHPEVRLEAPFELRGWVARTTGASGGAHVHPCSPQGDHWQRRVEGTPVSALVAADGVRARTLCLSEQWPDGTEGSPFRYGGACAPASLGPGTLMTDAAARAVAGFALRGLVSVDMLADGGTFTVLEINPRPGAALEVYEAACGHGLFGLHVAACRGHLPEQALRPWRHAAAMLVWAERAWRLPPDWRWPAWAADRGRPGTVIPRGAPVCTVRALGPDAATARHRCALRREALLDRLARRAAVDAAEAAAPCPS